MITDAVEELRKYGINVYLPHSIDPDLWVGVDLDGTWANTTPDYCRRPPFPIGPEIQSTREVIDILVREVKVKCFTARAGEHRQKEMVRKWLENRGFPEMEITDRKDFNMWFYLDDRAITWVANTGRPPKCGTCGTYLDLRNTEVP